MLAGQVVGVDPTAWRIIDGKLYLGYDEATIGEWDRKPNQEVQQSIDSADRHWAELQPR